MCCSQPAHPQSSSQKAPTLGLPQTPPAWGGGMSLCLWRGELQEEGFLHVEDLHFECWEEPTEITPTLPFLLFSNPPGFSRQHKASVLQPEEGAQLSEVTPSSEQPMQFLMSMTMAKVSQPTENSQSHHPAVSLHKPSNAATKSSPAQGQLGHTTVSHCHPSVSTWAIQVNKTAALTASRKSSV